MTKSKNPSNPNRRPDAEFTPEHEAPPGLKAGGKTASKNVTAASERTSGDGRAKGNSDETLRQSCADALGRVSDVDGQNVDINVLDGEVTLTGSVSDFEAKQRLESLVEGCKGVKGVTNLIEVRETDVGSSAQGGQRRQPAQGTKDEFAKTSSQPVERGGAKSRESSGKTNLGSRPLTDSPTKSGL